MKKETLKQLKKLSIKYNKMKELNQLNQKEFNYLLMIIKQNINALNK